MIGPHRHTLTCVAWHVVRSSAGTLKTSAVNVGACLTTLGRTLPVRLIPRCISAICQRLVTVVAINLTKIASFCCKTGESLIGTQVEACSSGRFYRTFSAFPPLDGCLLFRLTTFPLTAMTPEPLLPDQTELRRPSRGIRWEDSRFWVIHRRREYGPFDYEWSHDLRGLTLLYRGSKFGEICNGQELFADLKEFRLPLLVSEVAAVAIGCISYAVLHGLSLAERKRLISFRLTQHGYSEFVQTSHS